MSSAIGNFNTFSYSSIVTGSMGASKLYVPVSKSSLMYSHFDHVSGVAAGRGQQGVSISKIQILNSMIERISSIKNQPKNSISDISDEQADALIKQYQQQMQQAIQTPYILSGAQPMAGDLFSINA